MKTPYTPPVITELTGAEAEKARAAFAADDESATTVQARAWTLVEVKKIRELLAIGGIAALPESLHADAVSKVKKGGDQWPNWLIMGLGVRALRQLIEGSGK